MIKTLNDQLVDYLPQIRRVVSRIAKDEGVVDDITQECCVRIIEKEKLWKNHNKLSQWINAVTRNVTITYLRKHWQRQRAVSLEEGPEERIQEKDFSIEDIRWVISQFKHLTPMQKKVMQLKYFEGMKSFEVAQNLGISASRVSHYLAEGLEILKRKAKSQGLLGMMLPWNWPKILKKSMVGSKTSVVKSGVLIYMKLISAIVVCVVGLILVNLHLSNADVANTVDRLALTSASDANSTQTLIKPLDQETLDPIDFEQKNAAAVAVKFMPEKISWSQTEQGKQLLSKLKDPNWNVVMKSADKIVKVGHDAIPALITLLKSDEKVKLKNTMDLIYVGAETKYGFGYLVTYDLDQLSGRAAWVISMILRRDLSEFMVQPMDKLYLYDATRLARKSGIQKIEKWWKENKKEWTPTDHLLSQLTSANPGIQLEALNYVGQSGMDPSIESRFFKDVFPALVTLLNDPIIDVQQSACKCIETLYFEKIWRVDRKLLKGLLLEEADCPTTIGKTKELVGDRLSSLFEIEKNVVSEVHEDGDMGSFSGTHSLVETIYYLTLSTSLDSHYRRLVRSDSGRKVVYHKIELSDDGVKIFKQDLDREIKNWQAMWKRCKASIAKLDSTRAKHE